MRQESGRSMIEMLGVLAIMGVITAVAATAIVRGLGTQKHMQVNEDVMYMVSKVRELHREYDSFAGINNATIFGAIGMTAKNPYGGAYELSVDPSNSRQFVVSISGLPQSDCEYFMTKAWSDSAGFQASGGKLGGASGTCNSAGSANVVRITYGE